MNSRWKWSVCGLGLLLSLAGCGTGGGGGGNTSGKAVITSISVQRDGLVAVGDGIIAFGDSVGGNTVAWIHPGDTTAAKITGNFLGDAVYCANKKIILVSGVQNGPKQVSVFDTQTSSLVAVPGTDVFDIAPGGSLENQNIAVDGNFVAILNRTLTGKQLVVVDVSGATPAVTTFTEALTNADSVDVDAGRGEVAVMEDNTDIAIFPVGGPASTIPQRLNTVTSANISIDYFPSIRIGNGKVIFREFSTAKAQLLDIATGSVTALSQNPSANAGSDQFINKGGFFAYFLNRPNAGDTDASQGNRIAIGAITDPTTIVVGSKADLGGGTLAGFGYSAAIPPNGSATYIAGRLGQSLGAGLNEPSILQGNFGNGFVLITDSAGQQVVAADVVATNNVVAFKVDQGGVGAVLGYVQ